MGRSRRFVLGVFARAFWLVFLPFCVIVTLVFLIQISALSAKIDLGGSDLLRLLVYLLPEILLYTLPFSLIAALANTFGRLSEENELVAFFALGHRPEEVLRFFLPLMVLFSLVIGVLSFALYPEMKERIDAFKNRKLVESTLRIEPKKLSQSFGPYHVFVAEKNASGAYRDIVLFDNSQKGSYHLFAARYAHASNRNGRVTLSLEEGMGATSDPARIELLKYRDFILYRYPRIRPRPDFSLRNYWMKAQSDKRRRGRMLYYLLVSLSPLLAFPMVMGLSIYNPRYERGRSAAVIFVVALAVYVPSAFIQRNGSIPLFVLSALGLLAAGIFLYRKRIAKVY
ncbi:LptF/LptG family permease [Nitratifractor sp.]